MAAEKVDFLMPTLEPELTAYVKDQAEALGIHDGDREPLRLQQQGILSEQDP